MRCFLFILTSLFLATLASAATCPAWAFSGNPPAMRVFLRTVQDRVQLLVRRYSGDGRSAHIEEAISLYEDFCKINGYLANQVLDLFTNFPDATANPICAPGDDGCNDQVADDINAFCNSLYTAGTNNNPSGVLEDISNALPYFADKRWVWVCKPIGSYIIAMGDALSKFLGPVSNRVSGKARTAAVNCQNLVLSRTKTISDRYKETN